MRGRGSGMRKGIAVAAVAIVAILPASCGERPAAATDDDVEVTIVTENTPARAPEVILEGREARRLQLAPMVGKKAPALQLTDWINSEGLALEDLEGKVVVLDFFGAWCPPCRALTPFLVELRERYADRGFEIVGIHTRRAAERGPAYVEETGIPYPVGFDTKGATVEAYRVDGFPDLYVVDREGILRFADIKTRPHDNIVHAVEELLAE